MSSIRTKVMAGTAAIIGTGCLIKGVNPLNLFKPVEEQANNNDNKENRKLKKKEKKSKYNKKMEKYSLNDLSSFNSKKKYKKKNILKKLINLDIDNMTKEELYLLNYKLKKYNIY